MKPVYLVISEDIRPPVGLRRVIKVIECDIADVHDLRERYLPPLQKEGICTRSDIYEREPGGVQIYIATNS
jgi:hypothetical protein